MCLQPIPWSLCSASPLPPYKNLYLHWDVKMGFHTGVLDPILSGGWHLNKPLFLSPSPVSQVWLLLQQATETGFGYFTTLPKRISIREKGLSWLSWNTTKWMRMANSVAFVGNALQMNLVLEFLWTVTLTDIIVLLWQMLSDLWLHQTGRPVIVCGLIKDINGKKKLLIQQMWNNKLEL